MNDMSMMPSPLVFSDSAADKVKALIVEEGNEDLKLRVFVTGGGCSGLSYGMAFEETIYEQDRVVESDGLRLVIDPTSLSYMAGSEIDFVDGLMGGGFAINNPNTLPACGCGPSSGTDACGAAGQGGGCCH